MALVSACTLVLVLVLVAFMFLGLFLGGEQELSTATKSGALNVAVQMLNPQVNSSSAQSSQFADMADKNGNISLNNCNLVYAKALMIAANAEDIASQGLSNAMTTEHVNSAISDADSICQQIYQQVSNASTIQNYFQAFSTNNSVRMFGGQNPQVEADTGFGVGNAWRVGYVFSGTESNVSINPSQLPLTSGVSAQLVMAHGQSYFPGYTNIMVGSKTFNFVPYKYSGQPRMVSPSVFNSSMTAPTASVTVLPNSWSVMGEEINGNVSGATSTAFVATNPEQVYPFQMQGFLRFTLESNNYTLEIDGEPAGEGSYGFGPFTMPVESWEVEVPPYCCLAQMQIEFGNENDPGDLYTVLFPPTSIESGEEETMPVLLQRVNEFCPNCTTANITAALATQMTTESTSTQQFYLYCTRTGDPTSLTCTSSPSPPYSFMSFNTAADSTPMIISEQEFAPDDPNFGELEVEPEGDCEGGGGATVECTSSTLTWAPGTGYNGFLGELTLKRTWLGTGFAVCIPIPIP